MKYLKLFENFDNNIDSVIEFIQPSNPMDSEEYTYYVFGDDEAYYGGISLEEYMDAIEGSVFRPDSNTSKKFGLDFIQQHKEEILKRCKEDLELSGIDFTSDSKDLESLDESKKSSVSKILKNKSKASGIPVGILRKVFSRGMQAWNAGHRPGVAQHQWAVGRVNSFITGSGGARKADADLWNKAKAAKAKKKK
jgi:hypothetical protein